MGEAPHDTPASSRMTLRCVGPREENLDAIRGSVSGIKHLSRVRALRLFGKKTRSGYAPIYVQFFLSEQEDLDTQGRVLEEIDRTLRGMGIHLAE